MKRASLVGGSWAFAALGIVGVIGLGGLAPAAWAQGEVQAAPPFTAGVVAAAEWSEPRSWLRHPKDQAMGEALRAVPARVAELLRDPSVDAPPEALELADALVPLLGRAGRVVVKYNEAPTGGFYGYGLQFGLRLRDADEGKRLHGTVTARLAEDGGPRLRPSKRFPGMSEAQLPVGLVSFGPREATDGWRYEVVVGTFDEPDGGLDALPRTPEGEKPLVRALLDLRGLTPAADLALQFAGPDVQEQAAPFVAAAERRGLLGPGAMRLERAVATGPGAMSSTSTLRHAGARAAALGLSKDALTPTQLSAIPADVTSAWMFRFSDTLAADAWSGVVEALEGTDAPDIAALPARARAFSSADLDREIFGALGGVVALYASDAVGGAGIGGTVLLVSLRDPAAFASGLEKLAASVNTLGDRHRLGPGRVRLHRWTHEGATLWSVRIDGLPVPVEMTFGVAGDWFLATLTPQGAIVAARQAMGRGDAGLATLPALRSALPEGGVVGVTYTDTARALRDGYAWTNAMGAAVANLVRSPSDGSRDPGLLVPSYRELAQDVRPSVGWTRWEGDDLVGRTWSDPSQLVNATALTARWTGVGGALPSMVIQGVSTYIASRRGELP